MRYLQKFVRSVPLFILLSVLLRSSGQTVEGQSIEGTKAGSAQSVQELCKPRNVHLSFGNTTDVIVVMWTTLSKCTVEVRYADHPWNLSNKVTGSTVQLGTKDGSQSVFVHQAVLKDLKPSQNYFYQPYSEGVTVVNSYFKVPDAGHTWGPQFLVLGDLGTDARNPISKAVVEKALTGVYTAIMCNDDLEAQLVGQNGPQFPSEFTPAFSKLPFMTSPGNTKGIGGSKFALYSNFFSMPSNSWPMESSRLWYSMDIGLVHIIRYATHMFLDGDGDKTMDDLRKWLVKDLTEVNKKRSETPWIIAMGYDPMYCSVLGSDCALNTSKVRHGLEDIFHYFAIDLVIENQKGPYERSWPHYKSVLLSKSYYQPAAPVEIIMGSGKVDVKPTPVPDNNTETSSPPDWLAVQIPIDENTHTFAKLNVVNSSHLHWTLMSVTDNLVLDSFWLEQENHGNFSLANLPHNVSHQINQSIIAHGGKPGTYDFISKADTDKETEANEGMSKYSLWLGLAVVGGIAGLLFGAITIRSCLRKRRANAGRRWREVDRQADGGRFYSVASDTDSDGDTNDFEIDVYEKSGKPGSKLLTSY